MKYRNPSRSARSAKLFEHACKTIPGGINSTARATWSGWDPYPLFVERGEGAYLVDKDGKRFMIGADPRAELAPRDIVVRHIKAVMDRDGSDHVWLDARHLDCQFLRKRFPTVHSGLESRGSRK